MFLRRRATASCTDEDLVMQVREGQASAMAILWDRYAHLLFGVAMKYLRGTDRSKDLVLEVYAALPGLLAQQDVRAFRPWIHTVVRNRCLMLLRKRDHEVHVDVMDRTAAEEEGEERALHEADLQRLECAIDQLNHAQRACVRLFYLERNSYAQVAERTGDPIAQVRSHLQNGRRNLRILLTRSPDGEYPHADPSHR